MENPTTEKPVYKQHYLPCQVCNHYDSNGCNVANRSFLRRRTLTTLKHRYKYDYRVRNTFFDILKNIFNNSMIQVERQEIHIRMNDDYRCIFHTKLPENKGLREDYEEYMNNVLM